RITSVLVGASRVEQLQENLAILQAPDFTQNELEKIEDLLKGMPA
ncbi:MAG: L-glyceraldehyde 3-phosphate reductase, partial [Bacteroidales bacterium]|nr:L-glyceraldehyde 3-phosphate reductase [Bacteroidales bacterium]